MVGRRANAVSPCRRQGEETVITTIITQITDSGVNLAWDSKVSPYGNHPEKVKQVNGQFWLGIAGYSRHSDVLHYAEVPEVHPAELNAHGFDARGYLVTQVVPAWLRALKKSHELDPDTSDDWPKGSALVVIAGRVFTTDSVFSVTEHPTNTGIGSGARYALGALAAGKNIQRAIEVAAELDPGTGGELFVRKGLK